MASRVLILEQGRTAELIGAVLSAAVDGARSSAVRKLVAEAYARAAEHLKREPSAFELFHEVYGLALARFTFTPDPAGEELLQPAEVTLEEGIGDCDDATALVLALARASGLAGRAVLLSRTLPSGELEALHLFAQVQSPSGFLPADLGGYRAVGEAPPAPVAASYVYADLEGGKPGVGFLSGIISGIFGLGAARQQRKAAEAAGAAAIAAQRLENEGLLEVAEKGLEGIETQAQALQRVALIEGKVRAEELESGERKLARLSSLVRELFPLLVLGVAVVAFAPALKTLRAPAAARPAPSGKPAPASRRHRARVASRPSARRRGKVRA